MSPGETQFLLTRLKSNYSMINKKGGSKMEILQSFMLLENLPQSNFSVGFLKREQCSSDPSRGAINSKKFVRLLVGVKREIFNKVRNPIIVLDNASCHTSEYTRRLLKKHFKLLFIAPHSPELNPIENAFGFFKNRVASELPKTKETLILATKKIWKKISPLECKQTIAKLKENCQQILDVGGSNHYV